MTTGILYARHSPRSATECDSCQKQHERQRAYCLAMGWEVILEGKDEGNGSVDQSADADD